MDYYKNKQIIVFGIRSSLFISCLHQTCLKKGSQAVSALLRDIGREKNKTRLRNQNNHETSETFKNIPRVIFPSVGR